MIFFLLMNVKKNKDYRTKACQFHCHNQYDFLWAEALGK